MVQESDDKELALRKQYVQEQLTKAGLLTGLETKATEHGADGKAGVDEAINRFAANKTLYAAITDHAASTSKIATQFALMVEMQMLESAKQSRQALKPRVSHVASLPPSADMAHSAEQGDRQRYIRNTLKQFEGGRLLRDLEEKARMRKMHPTTAISDAIRGFAAQDVAYRAALTDEDLPRTFKLRVDIQMQLNADKSSQPDAAER